LFSSAALCLSCERLLHATSAAHAQQAGEPAQSKLAAAAFIKDVEKMSVSLRAAQARNMLDFEELQLALRSLTQITDDEEVFSTEQRATAAKLQRQLEGSRLRQVSVGVHTCSVYVSAEHRCLP
jgi:hypothetical protein